MHVIFMLDPLCHLYRLVLVPINRLAFGIAEQFAVNVFIHSHFVGSVHLCVKKTKLDEITWI
jgi:hypothetical protein